MIDEVSMSLHCQRGKVTTESKVNSPTSGLSHINQENQGLEQKGDLQITYL